MPGRWGVRRGVLCGQNGHRYGVDRHFIGRHRVSFLQWLDVTCRGRRSRHGRGRPELGAGAVTLGPERGAADRRDPGPDRRRPQRRTRLCAEQRVAPAADIAEGLGRAAGRRHHGSRRHACRRRRRIGPARIFGLAARCAGAGLDRRCRRARQRVAHRVALCATCAGHFRQRQRRVDRVGRGQRFRWSPRPWRGLAAASLWPYRAGGAARR